MSAALEDLAQIVTALNASEEEKRLALSIAFERGKLDAIRKLDANALAALESFL